MSKRISDNRRKTITEKFQEFFLFVLGQTNFLGERLLIAIRNFIEKMGFMIKMCISSGIYLECPKIDFDQSISTPFFKSQ